MLTGVVGTHTRVRVGRWVCSDHHAGVSGLEEVCPCVAL